MPGKNLSSWVSQLTDWTDDNGLECLNPLHTPTWARSREGNCPSVIDLVFANNCAHFSGQLSDVDVSFEMYLGSDHATLSINIYPLTSLAILPPPQPTGYRAEDGAKDVWMRELSLRPPTRMWVP